MSIENLCLVTTMLLEKNNQTVTQELAKVSSSSTGYLHSSDFTKAANKCGLFFRACQQQLSQVVVELCPNSDDDGNYNFGQLQLSNGFSNSHNDVRCVTKKYCEKYEEVSEISLYVIVSALAVLSLVSAAIIYYRREAIKSRFFPEEIEMDELKPLTDSTQTTYTA